mgnify:FL=1
MFRLFGLILTVFICVLSVAAVYYNKMPYLIDFHVIQFDDIPLGIFLFLSMLLGIIIATFFLIGLVLSVRRKYKNLKKDHELLDKEVQNLRRIPIQE